MQADEAGVYTVDVDYLTIDISDCTYTDSDFEKLPSVLKIGEGKYLFLDFIKTCYTALKPDYNPHKPAFRALERHRLALNETRNQAIFKLAASLLNVNDNENGNKGGVGGNKKRTEHINGDFIKFWLAYPKKKSKGDAEKWWAKNNPSPELAEKMLQTISKLSQTDQWKKDGGKFIPFPTSWLNSKGWEDEVTEGAQLYTQKMVL